MSKNYEELRAKNIEDNKRILAELGLLNPFKPLPKVRKNKIIRKIKEEKPADKPSKYVITNEETKPEDLEGYGSTYSEGNSRATRKSSRLRGKKIDLSEAVLDQAYEEAEEEMEEARAKRRVLANRPMVYGPIPDVEVGTWWATRMECNHDGIHRPTVAGIHPGPKGAYSIALSGGYEDDIDMGDCFTYTGEGGRDLKGTASNPKNLRTAPQSKDQCLSRGNMALKTSSETGFPIRVIRGFKSDSPFAPDEGYRYDGLYKCEKAWYTVGMAGFGVWKFALRRVEDQAPPPWTIDSEEGSKPEKDSESADTKDDVKEERVELKDEQAEVKKDVDDTKDVKTKIQKKEVQERSSKEEPDKVKEKKDEKKLKNKVTEEEEEIKEDCTTEIKEENNNDEGLTKSRQTAVKPMKEIQTTKNEKKKGQKRNKSDDEEFEDEDEEETKPKKVKKETKKEKKEKENTAMSKGLMGWLIKTP